jgi:hypothetical protein
VVVFTIITSFLILLAGISRNVRDDFTNPGPISSVHASPAFADTHMKISGGNDSSCAACHEGAAQGVGSWTSKAFDAFTHGLAPAEWMRKGPLASSAMDKNCLSCHQNRDFHQPDMAAEFACHECHKEHQNSGFMPEVDSSYCTSCHGSAELMAASREKEMKTDPHAFPSSLTNADLKIQPRKRPDKGYTEVITAFHIDHPEFQLVRDKTEDGNTLKFNHAVHLGVNFSRHEDNSKQRTLTCTDCHERDGRGEYQRPITYEKQCAECHALQFDKTTPGLHLPHGDPYYVRSFLRSLNIQYEEYGRSQEGMTRRDELIAYVREKRANVEKEYETGEFLEQAVFFAGNDKKTPSGRPAAYKGCATCHDVSEPASDNATPRIKDVSIPDRWMVHGKFNHDMHQKGLKCIDCHNVMESKDTRDLNLPSIKSCVECHSPKGGIDSRCIRCHTYHNSRPGNLLPKSSGSTFAPDKAGSAK